MNKKCSHCEKGYVVKNGNYFPCKYCMTPERFEKTLNTAISNCANDLARKKTLIRIKRNLPEYPVVALMEAESHGGFSKEFITMLKEAYDVRPFEDVTYKEI